MSTPESEGPEVLDVSDVSEAAPAVDEEAARKLADQHGLPEIEVDAALYGEDLRLAESVLSWIDAEEGKLVREHGLIEGRKRYRPVRMLKSYARKYGTGRRRAS